jgi:type I restriction enzyme, S subunit
MSWTPQRLDQLGYLSRGRSRHRPRDAEHLYGGPFPFIQTGDVKHAGLYLKDYQQTYSEAGLQQSRLWPAGTLCITIAANIADTAILGIDACFPDSVIGFIADEKKADTRFVKYLFDATIQRHVRQFTQGAAQDNLSQEKLLSFEFSVPNVAEQKSIADVLSVYDALIENNRRRLRLLEQAGQLLYKEWFVRLRFPGHEHVKIKDGVPEGWVKKPLGDVIEIKKGKNITADTAVDGDVPVVAGGLTPAYYHNIANVVGPAVTVSASGANAGFVNLYHENIWASDCPYVGADATDYIYYFYLLLTSQQSEISMLQKGAAQPHVYPKDLMRLTVLCPPENFVKYFEQEASKNFLLVGNLIKQNKLLAKARDILLPHLMNGEVAV